MNEKYDVPAAIVGKVVRTLLESGAHKVTAYLSPNQTVKACRKMYEGKISTPRDTRADVTVTVGVPNYSERRFIKMARAAGEPFPIKKLQIKQPPQRRGAVI